MGRFFDDEDDDSSDRGEAQAERSGRVTFDDRGNAVWSTGLRKPLAHPALSLAQDEPPSVGEVRNNTTGLQSGYNPYESGLLKGGKKESFRRKKDLAALSKWIQLKKNMDGPGEG